MGWKQFGDFIDLDPDPDSNNIMDPDKSIRTHITEHKILKLEIILKYNILQSEKFLLEYLCCYGFSIEAYFYMKI